MPAAFMWNERLSASVSIVSTDPASPPAASMPLSNLLDPQPRVRARFVNFKCAFQFDLGTTQPIDCVALISTNLGSDAQVRVRFGNTEDMALPVYDTGLVDASTAATVGGNVILLPPAQTVRYLRINCVTTSNEVVDIGRCVAGPLWTLARGAAYGIAEGRLILDRRDRNPLTGAEFPVPALANPRVARFTLPLLTAAEIRGQHRAMLRDIGGGDALWIPDTGLAQSELNARCLWGAVADAGAQALASRDNPAGSSRAFTITERV